MNLPPETAFAVLALVGTVTVLLFLRARGSGTSRYVLASAVSTGVVIFGARIAMGVLAPGLG